MDKREAKLTESSAASKNDGRGDKPAKRSRANTEGAAAAQGDTGNPASEDDTMVGPQNDPRKEGKGKGKGKGKGRNRHRHRRSQQGMKPVPLKTKDPALIHILNLFGSCIQNLYYKVNLIAGVLLTQVIMKKDVEPAHATIEQSNSFQFLLEERREEAKAEGKKPPAIGPPHPGIFHSFVEALSKCDIGQKNKAELSKWLQSLATEHVDHEFAFIDQVCGSFQVFDVANQPELCRMQIYMPSSSFRA